MSLGGRGGHLSQPDDQSGPFRLVKVTSLGRFDRNAAQDLLERFGHLSSCLCHHGLEACGTRVFLSVGLLQKWCIMSELLQCSAVLSGRNRLPDRGDGTLRTPMDAIHIIIDSPVTSLDLRTGEHGFGLDTENLSVLPSAAAQ
jgi:hypothetical protein